MVSHISEEAYDDLVERLESDRPAAELYEEQAGDRELEPVPVEVEDQGGYQEEETMARPWPDESPEDQKYSEEHKAWHEEVMRQYK